MRVASWVPTMGLFLPMLWRPWSCTYLMYLTTLLVAHWRFCIVFWHFFSNFDWRVMVIVFWVQYRFHYFRRWQRNHLERMETSCYLTRNSLMLVSKYMEFSLLAMIIKANALFLSISMLSIHYEQTTILEEV